jgi:phage shock protein PspC (stress-responsive transcriptional regulator)
MSKKLFRSNKEKVLGGVCGGIGNYFDVDPVIVRILFVVAAISWGTGIILYLIAWIIIPKEEIIYSQQGNYDNSNDAEMSGFQTTAENIKSKSKSKNFFGFALIIIGGLILFDDYVNIMKIKYLFPIILIVAGIYLILNQGKKDEN